jgi:hypothetical protein
MSILVCIAGVLLIVTALVDGFIAMVLPRRVNRRWRPTRIFYLCAWAPWAAISRRIRSDRRRGSFLGVFGPLSLIVLFALWALALIIGFGLLPWSLGLPIKTPDGGKTLATYLYMSGVTFLTVSFGDVTPVDSIGRVLVILEAGVGFSFLAVVISYLPVLYQAFSRREAQISLLDARAGSPPSAGQLLLRMAHAGDGLPLDRFLREWEQWCAELLESHLSFPMLSYYRSQHDNQSWLAALTVFLDTSALAIAGCKQCSAYQAQLTFAMARHAAVDLSLVFNTPPRPLDADRLPQAALLRLMDSLRESGVALEKGPAVESKLTELRAMYEPFINGLARYLLFAVPAVFSEEQTIDNWQTSAWMRRVQRGVGRLSTLDDHFD